MADNYPEFIVIVVVVVVVVRIRLGIHRIMYPIVRNVSYRIVSYRHQKPAIIIAIVIMIDPNNKPQNEKDKKRQTCRENEKKVNLIILDHNNPLA